MYVIFIDLIAGIAVPIHLPSSMTHLKRMDVFTHLIMCKSHHGWHLKFDVWMLYPHSIIAENHVGGYMLHSVFACDHGMSNLHMTCPKLEIRTE